METAIENESRTGPSIGSQLQMDDRSSRPEFRLRAYLYGPGVRAGGLGRRVELPSRRIPAATQLPDSSPTPMRHENGHEVARVSELLRSQLLQPINITPIQPSQAIRNLLLLILGPTGTSFTEFNTLMVNRDRLTFLGSGLYGNNATASGEGIVAGIFGKLSLSAGYANFMTDGWRANATQRDDNVNVFMQYEFSPRTSIQGEYSYRNLQRGDVRQRFFARTSTPFPTIGLATNSLESVVAIVLHPIRSC